MTSPGESCPLDTLCPRRHQSGHVACDSRTAASAVSSSSAPSSVPVFSAVTALSAKVLSSDHILTDAEPPVLQFGAESVVGRFPNDGEGPEEFHFTLRTASGLILLIGYICLIRRQVLHRLW